MKKKFLGSLIISFTMLLNICATEEFGSAAQIDDLAERLMSNVSGGVVAAAASKNKPNYRFHKVRDAAIVMDAVHTLYLREQDPIKKQMYKQTLLDYANFSKENQDIAGLGEFKFNLDGTPLEEARTVLHDVGPALRAITLIKVANTLISEGTEGRRFVENVLYSANSPKTTVITRDLEYISRNVNVASYDYWGEVLGTHFATQLIQRRALTEGRDLAIWAYHKEVLRDYARKIKLLERSLNGSGYWTASEGPGKSLGATKEETFKGKNVRDAATILGVLHAKGSDNFYSASHEKVLATAFQVEEMSLVKFAGIQKGFYPMGTGSAIGRYSADKYDGYTLGSKGNPWFLTTLAYAELYIDIKKDFERKKVITVTPSSAQFFFSLTDDSQYTRVKKAFSFSTRDPRAEIILAALDKRVRGYFLRAEAHRGMSTDGHLSEQIDRRYASLTGARQHSWTYATYLSALLAL